MRFGIRLFLLLCLTAPLPAPAQTTFTGTDSIRARINLTILSNQFSNAAALYKLEKYKLGNEWNAAPDTVFYSCWERYLKLYEQVPAAHRPLFFSDAFYDAAIATAQYFRNAGPVSVLMAHRRQLHPVAEAPDPKHDHPHTTSEAHHHER